MDGPSSEKSGLPRSRHRQGLRYSFLPTCYRNNKPEINTSENVENTSFGLALERTESATTIQDRCQTHDRLAKRGSTFRNGNGRGWLQCHSFSLSLPYTHRSWNASISFCCPSTIYITCGAPPFPHTPLKILKSSTVTYYLLVVLLSQHYHPIPHSTGQASSQHGYLSKFSFICSSGALA